MLVVTVRRLERSLRRLGRGDLDQEILGMRALLEFGFLGLLRIAALLRFVYMMYCMSRMHTVLQ